uniref:Uncharacterized protein n=1 Tax=Rangifer tarandus platyrhynchus TaxID=3082113 RepID=A0ACB0EXK1_RANTA|nr:unnamed protein product [Rangifer tarandus platyrhynchus]
MACAAKSSSTPPPTPGLGGLSLPAPHSFTAWRFPYRIVTARASSLRFSERRGRVPSAHCGNLGASTEHTTRRRAVPLDDSTQEPQPKAGADKAKEEPRRRGDTSEVNPGHHGS